MSPREETIVKILKGEDGWEFTYLDRDNNCVCFTKWVKWTEEDGDEHYVTFEIPIKGFIDACSKLYLQYNDEDAVKLLMS